MPVLKRRVDDSDKIHPRQTEYYIHAKPPNVGNITYQIDKRAVNFLVDVKGYGNQDQLPWGLVHPLRQIRDLYTLDEGRPRDSGTDEFTSEEVALPTLDEEDETDLINYLRSHPDVTGDFDTFRVRLQRGDRSYLDALSRDGYTPVETPGFDGTGDEALDRIATQFFGSGGVETIEWNGETISDYIEVTDRNGTTHRFPKLDSRLHAGELYRISKDIYERWGPEIGDSEVNSRRYEPGEEGFPNRWIGQREGSPEPSLEHAKSPRAFIYRTLAGRSHYAPGLEIEEAFEDACPYSLEVYKANFPRAVDPIELQTEYLTVEEAVEPWNDFQVPPKWMDAYPETGGLPPLKRTLNLPSDLSSRARDLVERRSPGGSDNLWFESVDEAVELVQSEAYRDLLYAADEADFDVLDFRRGGAAQPTFEVAIGETRMTATIEHRESCYVTIGSEVSGEHSFLTDGSYIPEWNLPNSENSKDAHQVLREQARWFDDVEQFISLLMDAT